MRDKGPDNVIYVWNCVHCNSVTVRAEVVLVIGRKESPTQRDWVEHNCKVYISCITFVRGNWMVCKGWSLHIRPNLQ